MTPDRGLDADGHIRREGALDRVPPAFVPLVVDLSTAVDATLPWRDGLYLYGSIPRGAAVPGRSDLDAVILTPGEPSEADRAAAADLERALDAAHEQIDGVGIGLLSRTVVLSAIERYDLGFFLACLCTPLAGADVATELPRYRPDAELARDTNGDVGRVLAGSRAELPAADAARRRVICRRVARKTMRTAFGLVMPRWCGWESDLDRIAAIVAGYYPDWTGALDRAVALARRSTDDPAQITAMLDFGDVLAAEFADRIGVRTRP